MDTPTLTKEQIETAKKDVSHPVVQVLLDMQDYIGKFNLNCKEREGSEDYQSFIGENLAPVAERLEELYNFYLGPLDLVSVWSKVTQDFQSLYARYNLAAAIPSAYGKIGITSNGWEGIIPFIAKEKRLPERVMGDEKNQLYFYKRLMDVTKSLDELDFYSYGTRENFADVAEKAYVDGNQEAKIELEKIITWQKEHKDAILLGIHENFGNGFSGSSLFVNNMHDVRDIIKSLSK